MTRLGLEVRVMNAKANYIDEKVQELREKLYLAAKKSKTRRIHKLYTGHTNRKRKKEGHRKAVWGRTTCTV